jgi:hypothetical protein
VNPDEQLRRVARERVWPILEFAKPEAMQRNITREQKAGAASAAAATVALGLAWYVRYRKNR